MCNLSGVELVEAVKRVTGLTGNVDAMFVDAITAYDINLFNCHPDPKSTHQKPYGATCFDRLVNQTIANDGCPPQARFVIYDDNVSYGYTPMEAVFRSIVKRLGKD